MQSMHKNFTTSSEPFSVRRFEARDREAVLTLWPADLMNSLSGSEIIDVLIDSVEGAIAGTHHVWVAEAFGRVIGSAAVIRDNASLAHLRCLSVAPDFTDRHVVARALAEMAIRDAWERGYLKLVVHTNAAPSRLTAALHDLGFEFSREHSMGGEHVLEFYQNLYERPRSSLSQDGPSL
jgi:N-acetylglutamate synthase-like GNAT family acetyltransferase